MKQEKIIKTIANKYNAIKFDLDERGKRRWAAAEARSLGWGGITAVSLATGISDRTIRNGLSEIKNVKRLESSRQRKKGAGRNCREIEQPNLIKSLERLIESSTRGDPMSPLRWTCKSTRKLANELNTQGFNVSSSKVASLLKALGYSLQSNKKTVEGKQHPDRNAQFEFIAARIKSKERNSEPAISVDTKKKENIGLYKNSGKVYQKKGRPIKVNTHDFPDKNLGKVVPYGVYDIALNAAGVSIGISHDTAEFAVAAIKRWWKKMGSKKYNSSKKRFFGIMCGTEATDTLL